MERKDRIKEIKKAKKNRDSAKALLDERRVAVKEAVNDLGQAKSMAAMLERELGQKVADGGNVDDLVDELTKARTVIEARESALEVHKEAEQAAAEGVRIAQKEYYVQAAMLANEEAVKHVAEDAKIRQREMELAAHLRGAAVTIKKLIDTNRRTQTEEEKVLLSRAGAFDRIAQMIERGDKHKYEYFRKHGHMWDIEEEPRPAGIKKSEEGEFMTKAARKEVMSAVEEKEPDKPKSKGIPQKALDALSAAMSDNMKMDLGEETEGTGALA